jgi:hypothetical protein
MAKLSVAAFSSVSGSLVAGQPTESLVLDFASGAVETAVLDVSNVRFVRLCADAPCLYETGVSPTVSAASRYLPANTVEVFRLDPGNRIRVAAAAE